jgi:MFS family permease
VIGFATAWPLVLVARFADRTGKGIRTSPRDALIAGDTPENMRGRAFGFHRAFDSAGAVLGPLIALGLYEMLDHRLRPLFFLAFVPAAISVALIAFVTERHVPSKRAGPMARTPLPSSYRRLVVPLVLFGLVNFSDALLIVRAKQLGLGFVSIILVYALYNVVYAGLSYPAGNLSDRVPRNVVFATGLVVFAVAYAGLGIATSGGWVWLLLPLYGAYTALTDGVSKAWVSDYLSRDQLAWGLGLFQGLQGGAAVLAGAWAGLAWGSAGRLPLVVSGAFAFLIAIVLLFRREGSLTNPAGAATEAARS